MLEFTFYAPLRVVFEKKGIRDVGKYVSRNGNRVLLVTGKKHLKETGKIDEILESLKRSDKIEEIIIFSDTPQNPDIDAIHEARDMIVKYNLNVVLAVGGGSSMDLAKAASICAKHKKDVMDIFNDPMLPVLDAYPIICSPTTSGSGSEVTKYVVFNDNKRKLKMAMSSEGFFPKVSLIDPELTYSMPKEVIANTGFDALSHAIEAYTSRSACPITDAYCREAISLIHTHLVDAYKTKNQRAMDNMSLAAMFGGMALNVGRASLPHALEHSLSAYRPDLPHGLGLSMVMVPFMKRAFKCNMVKFADIAYFLGENISNDSLENAAKKSIDAVIKLKEQLNLKYTLKDFGFDKKEIDYLVDNTLFTMEHGLKNSPCKFTEKDVREIYYEALEG